MRFHWRVWFGLLQKRVKSNQCWGCFGRKTFTLGSSFSEAEVEKLLPLILAYKEQKLLSLWRISKQVSLTAPWVALNKVTLKLHRSYLKCNYAASPFMCLNVSSHHKGQNQASSACAKQHRFDILPSYIIMDIHRVLSSCFQDY